MTNLELFKVLSGISAENLSGAEALQSVTIASRRKTLKHSLLVAAAIALAALLAGCAVAYASGWFRHFFSTRSDVPLSAEQIQYIESNEQPVEQAQGSLGWSIELKSTISDGTVGYLVFQITAPNDIDLEQYLNPPSRNAKRLSPGNYRYGQKAAYSMAIASIGTVDREKNYMYIDNGTWLSDNDGQPNTVLYCLTLHCEKIYPDQPLGLEQPFGKDISFRIRFMGISLNYTDAAVEASIDAQYAGQDYFVDGDTVAGLFRSEVLTDEEWNFNVTLDADNQFVELLTQPTTLQARVWRYADAEKWTVVETQEPAEILSFRVTPFGASVVFKLTPDMNAASLPTFPDTDQQASAVMKNGSRIALQGDNGNLLAQTPIILNQLDHILLADGTTLYPPVK